MRICPLEELHKIPFLVQGISAYRRLPNYPSLEIFSRLYNGLMLVEGGSCVYEWEKKRVKLKAGDCLYLPHGSCHKMAEHSKGFSFICLNFSLRDEEDEELVFSDRPQLICCEPDPIITGLILKMADLFMSADRFFLRKACLYELFDRMIQLRSPLKGDPILGAVNYIKDHYTEEICCSELAGICFMSPARMYRQFRKTMGQTPTEYKNRLRIEAAKEMLCNEALPVNEVSRLLGFENFPYFCKIFKRVSGVTPLQYRKKRREQQ